jgi:hypothetical protein
MSAHHRRHHTYVSLLFCRLEYWIIFGIFSLLEVALDLMFWSVVVHFYMKRLFCLTATLLCRPARLPMHISIDVVKLGFLVYCQLPFHGYGNGAHFLYLQVCDKKSVLAHLLCLLQLAVLRAIQPAVCRALVSALPGGH